MEAVYYSPYTQEFLTVSATNKGWTVFVKQKTGVAQETHLENFKLTLLDYHYFLIGYL